MHVAFAALRQVPVGVTVTAGNGAERAEARRLVQPGGFYVFDRGYVDYDLFADLHALPCSFVARVKEAAAYEVGQEQALSAAARAAGVTQRCRAAPLGQRPSPPLCGAALAGGAGGHGPMPTLTGHRSSWCWSPIAWTWTPT